MNILIATDKFKHALTSFKVGEALEKGLKKAAPEFSIRSLPLSDGGDGLAEVVSYYLPFERQEMVVTGPLFRPVEAGFLFAADEQTAFVEMAEASGLHLLRPEEYNCLYTTSYGTGELLSAAIRHGAKKITIGIGGSATNDGGMGMAMALGYRFLDQQGEEVPPVGESLGRVQKIEPPETAIFNQVTIEVACDVTNYLTGPAGAAYVYGPQKGATPEALSQLERGMVHFASVVQRDLGIDMQTIRGGGAAGGMGAGCAAFLGAQLKSGIDLLFQISKADEQFRWADVILTGEGKIDSQTLEGKLIHGIVDRASAFGKPVIAICGTLDLPAERIRESGLTAAFSILTRPLLLPEAFAHTYEMLAETGFHIGSMLLLSGK
jgi:glycerate kinase